MIHEIEIAWRMLSILFKFCQKFWGSGWGLGTVYYFYIIEEDSEEISPESKYETFSPVI